MRRFSASPRPDYRDALSDFCDESDYRFCGAHGAGLSSFRSKGYKGVMVDISKARYGQCLTCKSPRVEAVNAAIKSGQSLRSLARELGISRASVMRHARNCLGWKVVVGAAQRHEKAIKHRKLEGDLRGALEEIEKLRAIAVEKQDTKLFLNCEKQRLKILSAIQRQIGKVPIEREVVVDASTRIDFRKVRLLLDETSLPEDLEHIGGPAIDTKPWLPADAPVAKIRVRWVAGAIGSGDTIRVEVADASPDELAAANDPSAVAAALRAVAEMVQVPEPDPEGE